MQLLPEIDMFLAVCLVHFTFVLSAADVGMCRILYGGDCVALVPVCFCCIRVYYV